MLLTCVKVDYTSKDALWKGKELSQSLCCTYEVRTVFNDVYHFTPTVNAFHLLF